MSKLLVAGLLLSLGGAALAQSVPSFQSTSDGAPNPAASELFFMVEELREEVRQLRGRVEEQQHQLDRLSRQGRDRYVDLDGRLLDLSSRLTELEDNPGQGGSSAAPQDGGQATAGEQGPAPEKQFRQPNDYERQTYEAIQEKIRAKQFPAAIDDLYQFISDYPEGDLTVNAYYWLGEIYLAESELAQARQAFTIVTARFPEHRKAADAAFKLGVVHQRAGETELAREAMEDVIATYPGTNAERLAEQFLANNPG